MTWFDSKGASLISNAIKEVQKKIDKALDIKEDSSGASSDKKRKDSADLTVSAWGSFTGSFFDNSPQASTEKAVTSSAPATPLKTIVEQQPPRSLSGFPSVSNPENKLKTQEATSKMIPNDPLLEKWEENSSQVSEDPVDPKYNDFTEISLLENVNTDEFTSSRLVVDNNEQKSESIVAPLQQFQPKEADLVNYNTTPDMAGKSEPFLCPTSPDSLEAESSNLISTSDAQSVSGEEMKSVRDEDIHAIDLTLCLEPQSLHKDSHVSVKNDPIDVSEGENLRLLDDFSLKSPDESSTAHSSESLEIITSESMEKSSSIEVLSSYGSSVMTSPQEIANVDIAGQEWFPITDMPAITKQPTSYASDWPNCSEEDLISSQDAPSIYASFAEDSACESIHSTSTSSTHTVLDAYPSQLVDLTEGLIDTFENEDSLETKNDDFTLSKTEPQDTPQERFRISIEEEIRKDVNENKSIVENLLEQDVQCTKESTKSDSSDSQGASSSPERETPSSDSYKSGSRKAQSGYTSEQYSSADEVDTETATSSDIEIISSPSSSDGYRPNVGMTPSPGVATKVWLSAQKGLRAAFMPERADSVTTAEDTVPSSLTTGFTSISESSGDSPQAPGPERLGNEMGKVNLALQEFKKSHKRNISNASEYSESSDAPMYEADRLIRKMDQMTVRNQERNAKVAELNKINSNLEDQNSQLKASLKTMTNSIDVVREENTQRMVSLERKFQKTLKENESLTERMEVYREQAAIQLSATELTKTVKDREDTIHELMSEGEKLSKQQLNYSNIVKKLRAKEKECDGVIKEQKTSLERQSVDLERLQKQLDAKEELERNQIEAIRQLTVANQKQEFDLKDVIADRQESDGKADALKNALDTALREVTNLQKTIATNDAKTQQENLLMEDEAKRSMESALEDAKSQADHDHQVYVAQLHELQDSLRRSDDQANRKERQLKNDICDLQKSLREAENRNKEMSDNVAAGTRPLLRQLENLHASKKIQEEVWERLEESHVQSLRQAEKAAAKSQGNERAMKEEHSDAMGEMANMQTIIMDLEYQKEKLEVEITNANTRAADSVEARTKDNNQLEAMKISFNDQIKTAQREYQVVGSQIELEKRSLTAEQKRNAALHEQLKDRDRKIAHLQTVINSRVSTDSSPTPSVSRMSASGSVNESFHSSICMDDVFESVQMPVKGASLYDSLRGHSAINIDILTSTLQQREGELHHMQSELTRSEAQKDTLCKELLFMTQKLDTLKTASDELKELKDTYLNLFKKHDTLLQMFGEKVEESNELQLDLQESKEVYKQQIEELLKKQ